MIIDDGWQNVEPDKEYRTSRTSTGTSKENSREHSRNDEDREKDDDDEDDDDDDDDDEVQAPLTTPTMKTTRLFCRVVLRFIGEDERTLERRRRLLAYPSHFDQLRVVRFCGHENGILVIFQSQSCVYPSE